MRLFNPLSPTSNLIRRFQRLLQRAPSAAQIHESASRLQLPFEAVPTPLTSIWWGSTPALQQLPDLPRSALSGPVQEDKAEAHGMLIRLVEKRQRQLPALDLREIDGLGGNSQHHPPYSSLEVYAASNDCRQVRIISYKDFQKTLQQALPELHQQPTLALLQANWRGKRLFWNSEQHGPELACAIAYARRRELHISLPAHVSTYHLHRHALEELQQHFHVLAMPNQAWSDQGFMGLLLDSRLPYSRLSLLRGPGHAECLLLPKRNAAANALGEGLRHAGAPDVIQFLQRLLD